MKAEMKKNAFNWILLFKNAKTASRLIKTSQRIEKLQEEERNNLSKKDKISN